MPKIASFLKRSLAQDNGALAPLFAILLAGGALIATIGLVVDFGNVYVEKRAVQFAADNIVETMAVHCAGSANGASCLTDNFTNVSITGVTVQTTSAATLMSQLANPKGGTNITVTNICGKSVRSLGIPACPALNTADPNECKVDLANASPTNPRPNFLRVYTQTAPKQPFFVTFSLDNRTYYYETACSQMYWGKAGALKPSSTTVPVMIGMCEISVNSTSNVVAIAGDTNEASCSVVDRAGTTFTANGRGWRQFDTSAATGNCWTLLLGGCSPVALPAAPTQVFVNTFKSSIDQGLLTPVYDKVGGSLTIRAFTNFKLLAYRFPRATGVTDTTYPTASTASTTVASGTKIFTVNSYGSLKIGDTLEVKAIDASLADNKLPTMNGTVLDLITTSGTDGSIVRNVKFTITGATNTTTKSYSSWAVSETTSTNTCSNASAFCIWGEYQNRIRSSSGGDFNSGAGYVKLADETSTAVPDFGYILVRHER
ncbi:MAG: TadE/TadG family type IV pilus assembly protein [Betaproteobacteria bacterium]